MTEQWLPVPGFESLYSVSDQGRVVSHRRWRCMKFRADRDGYLLVNFTDENSVKSTHKVHRLVAQAFIPNPSNLPEVDHRFGVRNDNRATELRWATVSTNRRNKTRTGAASGVVGVCFREGKRNPWQAYTCHDRQFKSLGHYATLEIAAEVRRQHAG